jgi:hypothetical protein
MNQYLGIRSICRFRDEVSQGRNLYHPSLQIFRASALFVVAQEGRRRSPARTTSDSARTTEFGWNWTKSDGVHSFVQASSFVREYDKLNIDRSTQF